MKEKPVIIIGPIPPYRGGISQHTMKLFEALKKITATNVISFKRQYPALIFPGESDTEDNKEFIECENIEYLIDSLNPITWYRAAKRCVELDASFVIIPWWTIFWAPCFFVVSTYLRAKNIKIAFFCHNVIEHESNKIKELLASVVLNNATWFVVHTKIDYFHLSCKFKGRRIVIYPHPIYDQYPLPKIKYEKNENIEVLFYGFVRHYKGLDVLIDALNLIKFEKVRLTIAGEFWEGLEEISNKIKSYDIDPIVEVISRYVTDEETACLFDKADVVVLPYRSATGSGVIPIAYNYNKPVIVTKVGGLPDVVLHGKTGLIVNPNDPKEIANAILKIKNFDMDEVRKNIIDFKKTMSWDGMAKVIVEVYKNDFVAK